MAVISLEEIEPFLPSVLTTPQKAMVEDLIDLVEGELAEILNRPLEITKFIDEVHVVNLTEPTLHLEQTPVLSVESVIADGTAVDAVMYTVRRWGLDFGGFNTLALVDPVIWTPSNAHFTWWQTPDVMLMASGAYPQSVWNVSYTAGLDGPRIHVLRSVLLRTIRRQIGGVFQGYNDQFTSMKVEDYSWTKSDRMLSNMTGSFLASDLKLLDHLTHKNYS